jgi:hypoxanthine phosphoribosyltransferase
MPARRDGMRVVYGRRRIARRVRELARALDRAYDGRPVTLCGVLTGGAVFAADLARAMRNDRVSLDFLKASSYGVGRRSSGRVRLTVLDPAGVRGRDVVVVEDILDTGRTLRAVSRALRERGARSVRTVVLLEKPVRRPPGMEADWVGFRMRTAAFVCGYGLDAGHRWRNLPDVVLAPAGVDGRRRP